MDRRLARRLVALAAAYAVVLNTLVPALGAFLLPATIGQAVICSAHAAGWTPEQGGPEKPSPLCPCGGACAMPGCVAIALPNADSTGVVAASESAVPAAFKLSGRRKEALWPGGRKLARGPPIA